MALPLDWTVDPIVCSAQRRPALEAGDTFSTIAAQVASSMKVLCCHKSQIRETPYKRPVYTIQVSKTLFDQFFNSSFGYRAAFYRSPGTGMDANACLLRAVRPGLLSHAVAGLSPELTEQSLNSSSAKAWLAESGKEPEGDCPTCKGEWSTGNCGPGDLAEVRNGRWEFAEGVKAEWGRKAPYLTKLRLMGAFLDDQHNEFIPHDKRARAQEIHELGWS